MAEVDRDDRAERGWPPGGRLEGRETAPADPEHAHAAGAPAPRGQPVDDRQVVEDLALGVLAGRGALGAARAAYVEPAADVAGRGERAVERPVARQRPVVLAVRDRLQDGGKRAGRIRHVQRRREPDPVVHRDLHLLRADWQPSGLPGQPVPANPGPGMRGLPHGTPPVRQGPGRQGRAGPLPAP